MLFVSHVNPGVMKLWSANILSAAGRAKKDCSKQDNSVTSYLNSGLLQLVQWKLESVSGEILDLLYGWVENFYY